jgi:hypothetical protein
MGKGLDVEPAQAIGSQEVLLVEWLLAKAELGNCDDSNSELLVDPWSRKPQHRGPDETEGVTV